MSAYAIELNEITKTYQDGDSRNTVLDQVSLQVRKSEFAAVMGPSGSGKSTLLSVAGALLSADEGAIILGNQDISNLSQWEWTRIRLEKIGFIFQNHQLIPFLTVEEQLAMVGDLNRSKAGTKEKLQIRIPELIHDLGLDSCKKRYPKNLSGGEKQRTAIARAFMNDPDLILADEPTASLDAARGKQAVELIRSEVKKRQKGAIMVTHDERVLSLADTVYYLENGKLRRI